MNDFASAQARLLEAKRNVATARLSARRAQERVKAQADAQKKGARTGAAGAEADAALAQRKAVAANDLAAAKAAAQAALAQFAPFADPRANAERLSDRIPFVLFPVRLETRFMAMTFDNVVRRQLWVRIYPDDCSIDTFEADLSAAELANAKIYWSNFYRAGGVEADQRAAWRSLVAAHGSARAGYIVDTYQPTNPPPLAKAKPTDEILVISTQAPLAASDADAVGSYWEAVWLADGDAAALAAAQAALVAAVGAGAQGLIDGYPPFNLADRPQPPLAKTDVALSVAFLILPADPTTKAGAWTQAPQVTHFPERFVVLGFNGGAQTLEAIGGGVATPALCRPRSLSGPDHRPQRGDPSGERRSVRAGRVEVDGRFRRRRGGGPRDQDRPQRRAVRGGLRPAAGAGSATGP